jgi:hypothetical protein
LAFEVEPLVGGLGGGVLRFIGSDQLDPIWWRAALPPLAQARSGVAFRAKLAVVMSLFGKNDYQLFNSAGVPSPDRYASGFGAIRSWE